MKLIDNCYHQPSSSFVCLLKIGIEVKLLWEIIKNNKQITTTWMHPMLLEVIEKLGNAIAVN